MTKFQAFYTGFWSAWDFTRPFSERPILHVRNEMLDMQLEQELGLNVGYWEEAGNYLREAMSCYEKEVNNNVHGE
jgi:hypothetical protein